MAIEAARSGTGVPPTRPDPLIVVSSASDLTGAVRRGIPFLEECFLAYFDGITVADWGGHQTSFTANIVLRDKIAQFSCGTLILFAHGCPRGLDVSPLSFFSPTWRDISLLDYVPQLREEQCRALKEIILVSCSTAGKRSDGGPSAARRLADATDVRVYAPAGLIQCGENEMIVIRHEKKDGRMFMVPFFRKTDSIRGAMWRALAGEFVGPMEDMVISKLEKGKETKEYTLYEFVKRKLEKGDRIHIELQHERLPSFCQLIVKTPSLAENLAVREIGLFRGAIMALEKGDIEIAQDLSKHAGFRGAPARSGRYGLGHVVHVALQKGCLALAQDLIQCPAFATIPWGGLYGRSHVAIEADFQRYSEIAEQIRATRSLALAEGPGTT